MPIDEWCWIRTDSDESPPQGQAVLGCYEAAKREPYFRVVFYLKDGETGRWVNSSGTMAEEPEYWCWMSGPKPDRLL